MVICRLVGEIGGGSVGGNLGGTVGSGSDCCGGVGSDCRRGGGSSSWRWQRLSWSVAMVSALVVLGRGEKHIKKIILLSTLLRNPSICQYLRKDNGRSDDDSNNDSSGGSRDADGSSSV